MFGLPRHLRYIADLSITATKRNILLMFKESSFLDSPPPDAPLWRYMDFTRFMSLLEKRSLFFARADRLNDPYEGFLPRYILENLRDNFTGNMNPEMNIFWNISQVFKSVAAFTLVCCWHENPRESAAMWSLYSRENDGIAIKTTYNSLSKSFKCKEDVYIGRIKYIDYDATHPVGILDEKDRLYQGLKSHDLTIRSPLFHKRDSYRHEQEVRALHPVSLKGLYSGGMTEEIAQPPYSGGIYLEVDLSLLIHDIIVSPFAPDWFVELIGLMATRYSLNKNVTKSSLADGPTWE